MSPSDTRVANETGDQMAAGFLRAVAAGAEPNALHTVVAQLAYPRSSVGDIALKALLRRVQQQLEVGMIDKRKRQPGQAGAGKTAHVNNCKSDSTGKPTAEQRDRKQVLANILRDIPGNTSEAQRNRLLAAMQALGSVTSREGSRSLDCYDPRARVYELRNQGKQITTVTRAEVTSGGETRRVGVYVLEGGAQ